MDSSYVVSKFYSTTKKPELTCEECGSPIEPIEGNNQYIIGSIGAGKIYLSIQPKVCHSCVDKYNMERRQELIKTRIKNVRRVAIQRNLPKKFALGVKNEDFTDEFHFNLVKRFIKQKESFLIVGQPESGKTHFVGWMFMMGLRSYPLIPAESFYFTSLLEMDEQIKKEWRESEILQLCRLEYLFFEFGDILDERRRDGKSTPWVDTLFFKIVKYRYDSSLPTVWITRLSSDEMYKMYDDATVGRIIETSTVLRMKDSKFRLKIAKGRKSYNL